MALVLQLALPVSVTLPEVDAPPMRALRLASPAVAPAAVPADLTAAPIFSPTRQRGGPGVASVVGGLSLVATAASGRGAMAVVRDGSGGTQLLRPGQRLQGWRLDRVTGDRAFFTSAQGRRVLRIGEAPPPEAAAETPEEQP
jgi:hypothetical protein